MLINNSCIVTPKSAELRGKPSEVCEHQLFPSSFPLHLAEQRGSGPKLEPSCTPEVCLGWEILGTELPGAYQ